MNKLNINYFGLQTAKIFPSVGVIFVSLEVFALGKHFAAMDMGQGRENPALGISRHAGL